MSIKIQNCLWLTMVWVGLASVSAAQTVPVGPLDSCPSLPHLAPGGGWRHG
jgi:hypothetical protein